MIKLFLSSFLILSSFSSFSRPIKICAEDSQWFPMVFKNVDGEISGVQYDIVKESLKELNLKYSIKLLPWKRCLRSVQEGRFDAALGASYTKQRAEYLNYPIGAKRSSEKSIANEFRIAQSDYVVITHKKMKFKFDGNLSAMPQPIYVPAGFSIAQDLRRVGLEVDDGAKKDILNFQKLHRSEKGSVVAIRELALAYAQRMSNGSDFVVSQRSIKSKSNFLAFSKKSKLDKTVRVSIWKSISNVRKKSVKKLFKSYSSN